MRQWWERWLGATALIPIFGAYIGAIVGAFMILSVSPVKVLVFLIFLVILQQLEGNLIYPRVVGSSIGLPGIWVFLAVTVGGRVAGVLGMLLGVPLMASVYKLVREDIRARQEKKRTGGRAAARRAGSKRSAAGRAGEVAPCVPG